MLKISRYKFVALDVTQGIKALQLYVQVVIISNEKVRWKTRSADCGVRSVENAECGKCGVWKMRGVENVNIKLSKNLIPLYSH